MHNLLKNLTIWSLVILTGMTGYTQTASAQQLSIYSLNTEVVGTDVTVNWRTSSAASGCVQFGLTADYEWQQCAIVAPSEQHRIQLVNLQPEKIYHYRVISKTSTGVEVTSFDATFKTNKRSDSTKPEILWSNLEYVGSDTVFLVWKTSEPASSRVNYGIGSDTSQQSERRRLTTYHEIQLSHLTPGATYSYQISSADESGNRVYGNVQKFKTSTNRNLDRDNLRFADVRPIGTRDTGISESSATITWRTTRPATGIVRYGTSPDRLRHSVKHDHRVVQHTLTLPNLNPGTRYYYDITSRDILGKQATVPGNNGTYSFTTQASSVTGLNPTGTSGPDPQPSVLTRLKDSVTGIFDQTPRVLGTKTSIYSAAQDLIKPLHSNKIYAIINQKKYWIRSPEIMQSYGYRFEDVRVASLAEASQYPDARLVKTPGSATVYFTYPDQGVKIAIPNAAIFSSYPSNRWGDIINISPEDLDAYEDATLVKSNDRDTVYLIENGKRRIILNPQVFEQHNLDWNKVATINNDHLLTFALGESLR